MSLATQRFEGASLEDALRAAVEALGADVQVSDARRVRSGGVAGFFSKERYEVLVRPGGGAVDETRVQAELDDALRALVEGVEDRAEPVTAFPPGSFGAALADAGWPADAGAPVAGLAEFVGVSVATDPAVHLVDLDFDAPDVDAPEALPVPVPVPVALDVPVPVPLRRHLPAVVTGEPRWSRQALKRLGVPDRVLRHLRPSSLRGDAAWTAALSEALEIELPPVRPGEDPELTVSGHGAASAVRLIDAGLHGFPPGTIHLEAGAVPATPFELALAVRSCLPR